jgi:hypothetical protein
MPIDTNPHNPAHFADALRMATTLHGQQVRKGTAARLGQPATQLRPCEPLAIACTTSFAAAQTPCQTRMAARGQRSW